MKIKCPFDFNLLLDTEFKCLTCLKCSSKENNLHNFQEDLTTALSFEEELKSFIEDNTNIYFKDLKIFKNADLSFFSVFQEEKLICRVEAKFLNGKAAVYMKEKIGLEGKESLVVDEPKLISYINQNIKDNENTIFYIPTYIVWYFGRPCSDFNNITVYQEITKLKEIYYNQNFEKRKFERKTTSFDISDKKKLGVTKKYHFSIKETNPIYNLVPDIFKVLSSYKELNNIIEIVKSYQQNINVIEENLYEYNISFILKTYTYLKTKKYIELTFNKIQKYPDKYKYFSFKELFDLNKIDKRILELD